jgi:hypothetical protein
MTPTSIGAGAGAAADFLEHPVNARSAAKIAGGRTCFNCMRPDSNQEVTDGK